MMPQLGCRQALCLLLCAVVLLVAPCSSVMLPIVPLPISFNFGGASPMSKEVQCSYGTSLEIDGSQHQLAKPSCGAARYAWKVVAESGAAAGSEIPLGPSASQQKLSLTLAPARGPGVLSKAGTYLVQVGISYEKCEREQGQTRVNVGPCPSSEEGSTSFELQACKDVAEPGKRKLTLKSSSSSSSTTAWQLAPSTAAAGAVSSSVSTEAGAQPLSCSGPGCVLLVGAGAGRVQPGRSYAVRYSTGDAAPAAAAAASSAGLGFNLGFGGFGFGMGKTQESSSSAAGGGSGWKELKGPAVDKCPPRVTRSAAALMGSCGSGMARWLEMQAAAVDVEEGPAGAGGLKYYWYVLSARTQDVVLEASGPSVKLEVGEGQGKLPAGRRYMVKLLVTAQAGGQVSSSKQVMDNVIDVPAC